jgi:hypothetical protein
MIMSKIKFTQIKLEVGYGFENGNFGRSLHRLTKGSIQRGKAIGQGFAENGKERTVS